jgi:homogentisate phytyltransferase/homogentisate geranylgeranyltransferase
VKRRLAAAIEGLESSTAPWGAWAATFVGLVVARNLLEGVLGPSRVLGFSHFASPSALMVLDHFLLFYVSVFLAIAILLSWAAREEIGRVMKAMTPAWTIVLLPPIVDFLTTGGEGARLSYVLSLESVVLRFFDPRAAVEHVSAGQRVEILLACHLAMLYVRVKTRSWPRAIGTFFAVYGIVAAHGVLPSVYARLAWLATEGTKVAHSVAYDAAFKAGGMIVEESRKLAIVFLATSTALGWATFGRHAAGAARAVCANVRPLRSLHYVVMTGFGIALAWAIFARAGVALGGAGDYLAIVATLAATFFAFQASVWLNDIFDVDADRIAEPGRPLPAGTVDRGLAVRLALTFAATALLFALNVKYATFLTLALALVASLLYSAPPLRLKRFPIVGTLTLGAASLLAALTGFSVLAEERAFVIFPAGLAWLLVLSFGAAFSAKDLKDTEGDRATGTYSFPVLLGPARGKAIVAVLVFVGYLLVPLLLPYAWLGWTALLAGAASVALVYLWKRPRVDRVLLVLYLAFALLTAITVVRDVEALTGRSDPLIDAKSSGYAAARARALGDRESAARAYAAAAEVQSDDPRLLELAGVALVESGEPEHAHRFLERSLGIDPSSPVAREYLAAATARAGWEDEAREILSWAVSEGVRPGVMIAQLGELDLESGDAITAAARFADALSLGRPDVPVRIRLGDALLAAGDAAAATREYETVVERRPSSHEARDALGRLLHARGELDRALEELREATALAPDEARYWNNVAVVYRDLEMYAQALDALETATVLDPRLADAYYNRGRVLGALGRQGEARRQYLLALEIDPGFAPARAALAENPPDGGLAD